MAFIIPAILAKNKEEFEREISLVQKMSKEVQIDVCDGTFAPSKSYIPEKSIAGAEYDLMVKNPSDMILRLVKSDAKRFIVHINSATDEEIDYIFTKYADLEIGLAIGEKTDMARVRLGGRVPFVQFMGIKKIGFQGEPFDESVIEKIKDIRKKFPRVIISVDGGVGAENIPALLKAGADRLVVGSTIWKSASPIQTFKKLCSKV